MSRKIRQIYKRIKWVWQRPDDLGGGALSHNSLTLPLPNVAMAQRNADVLQKTPRQTTRYSIYTQAGAQGQNPAPFLQWILMPRLAAMWSSDANTPPSSHRGIEEVTPLPVSHTKYPNETARIPPPANRRVRPATGLRQELRRLYRPPRDLRRVIYNDQGINTNTDPATDMPNKSQRATCLFLVLFGIPLFTDHAMRPTWTLHPSGNNDNNLHRYFHHYLTGADRRGNRAFYNFHRNGNKAWGNRGLRVGTPSELHTAQNNVTVPKGRSTVDFYEQNPYTFIRLTWPEYINPEIPYLYRWLEEFVDRMGDYQWDAGNIGTQIVRQMRRFPVRGLNTGRQRLASHDAKLDGYSSTLFNQTQLVGNLFDYTAHASNKEYGRGIPLPSGRASTGNAEWDYTKDTTLGDLLGKQTWAVDVAPGSQQQQRLGIAQQQPWLSRNQFKFICLQMFKTIGDLSKCVEFASPDPLIPDQPSRGGTRVWAMAERNSKIFISHDQLAITFARKLAAGVYHKELNAHGAGGGAPAPFPYLIYHTKGQGANVYTSPLTLDEWDNAYAKMVERGSLDFGSKRKKVRKKSSYGTKRKKAKRKRKRKVRKKSSYGTKRKKRKRKAKKKTIPLKDAKVKVAKRKWLGRYGGKVYKLTTLASRFGVSVKRGRGFKKAETIVKDLEKRMLVLKKKNGKSVRRRRRRVRGAS